MSIQDSAGVYDQAEFADNPEARCSIVLMLDVSGSMRGAKIDTVNQALVKFGEIIREDRVTALRADVAVIEFDHEARVVQDFTNGTDFEAPVLSVKGGTNYSKPVNLAPGPPRGPQAELPGRGYRLLPQPGLLPHRRLPGTRR